MGFSGADREARAWHGLSSKEMSMDLPGRGDRTAFKAGARLQSL